ncbi:MAG TPA: nuclear transport factor 2 family protein [Mycobacteriales bacterium]|nr:nuclear transport factor 2 family protein [Mycobacteriales bacterium]
MTDDDTRRANLGLMQQYQTLLFEQRFDEWIELWHDDGVCEFPFAAADRPKRLAGKDEILAYMNDYPSRLSIDGVEDLQVHQGLDPDVVVVEMTIRGRAVDTEKPYNQQYVIVAQTRDGKLAHYREYWNPLITAAAHS